MEENNKMSIFKVGERINYHKKTGYMLWLARTLNPYELSLNTYKANLVLE